MARGGLTPDPRGSDHGRCLSRARRGRARQADPAQVVSPRRGAAMTWIKTLSPHEGGEVLRVAIEAQRRLYPAEYADPVHPTGDGTSEIVASHSLIPEALHHAFSTFGVLMSADLPLERRQHEMIASRVSALNRCHY